MNHKLNAHNKYVIKDLANELPNMTYETLRYSQLPNKAWQSKVFNYLARIWITAGICRWWYLRKYASQHQINHERRMRRAYLANGVVGVLAYLKRNKVDAEIARMALADFELSPKDEHNLRGLMHPVYDHSNQPVTVSWHQQRRTST